MLAITRQSTVASPVPNIKKDESAKL
jgi:hypothetical protein